MTSILDADDVRRGLRAADAFWRDLGRDDDQALEGLLAPEALTVLGDGPGLAARIRERLRIDIASCACLGVVSPVPLAENRAMRPTYTFISVPVSERGQGQGAAWCIAVTEQDGAWLIDPTATGHPLEVAHRWLSLSMAWSRIAAE